MKKIIFLLTVFFISSAQVRAESVEPSSESIIGHLEISHAYTLRDWNFHPGDDRVVAIGGFVEFAGEVPFVTVSVGGQEYTTRTDSWGRFSLLVYANQNTFTATAWSSNHASDQIRFQSTKRSVSGQF